MYEVRRQVASLEEGVLRVLYEGPASACECAAGVVLYAYAAEVVTDELERLLAGLTAHGFVREVAESAPRRYAITAAGSERLASLVEAANR
ncbi:MAG TPA: hypothetical protein VMD07_01175 [Candidatus Acidoferrales bacterium]|nr:hypothetical protein [Candidatus Acidoferrales bacterium]